LMMMGASCGFPDIQTKMLNFQWVDVSVITIIDVLMFTLFGG